MPESDQRRFQYKYESSKTVSKKTDRSFRWVIKYVKSECLQEHNELYNLNPFEVHTSHFTSAELNG